MSVYNNNIPQPTDVLSNSQADMLVNFQQIDTQFAVDHTALNVSGNNGDGFHKKITLSTKNNPGAQTDPSSSVFSGDGTASSIAQLFFRNQSSNYPISLVKAFAICNGTTGAVVSSQSFNVTSVTRNSTGQYTVVMPANTLGSADYAVFIGCTNRASGSPSNPVFGSVANDVSTPTATSFVMRTWGQGTLVADPIRFWFAVIQI